MEKYSEAEIKKILEEATDPRRTILICGQHMYIGIGPPVMDCKDCWTVYYILQEAKTPPHKREERFAQLEALAHHLAETGEQLRLFDHPVVTVEKDKDDEE